MSVVRHLLSHGASWRSFESPGFTHICAKGRNGWLKVKRATSKKKMRSKLHAVKAEMRLRMHQPIPEQGRWLASFLQGHYNYYAVPDNIEALRGFRQQVIRHWRHTLSRRSQKGRITWERTRRLADRWLPHPPGTPSSRPRRALTPEPKGGAQCVRRARWDLCGGPLATAVPTAIAPGPDGQTIEALLEQWPVVLPKLQADLLSGHVSAWRDPPGVHSQGGGRAARAWDSRRDR